jgi:general secretion pathway protein D
MNKTRALLAALVLLTAGCAQMVRDRATEQIRQGRYEQAIKELQQGVESYPDNTMLRSSLISTRAEAISRWTTEAAQQRAAGKLDEAEKILQRALVTDPKNDRLRALLDELAAERRVQQRMEAAGKLAAEGKKAQAVQQLDLALREMPRHPGATGMRRQLEADLRMDSGTTGRMRIAETRPITLDFRAAPLSTVLEAVTRGSGVNFMMDKDVRQDTPVTVYLRSSTVEDALDLITGAHQLARRVVDPQTVLIYPNTAEKQKEHQEQVVRVFHLANAEAKSTAQLLRTMLRLKDAFVDERANMVAIRETPEVVALAERLVALHDSGDAEVMLEVEVLEIKTSRLTELGITVPNAVTLTPLASGSGGGLTVQSLRDIGAGRIGIAIGGVTMNLRREAGDFNILANPRIRAKNREKAKVVIGDRFPVVTTTSNASSAFVSESVSYIDVGLKLDVEPTVSLDDDVTIKMSLEVSALAGAVRTAAGSLVYQVGTRNANTVLRLRDGETQILAGLISNDDRATASRIPGLGDLPIAGRLFSSQKDEYSRTELVLAITPRVLRSATRPDISQAELWVGTESSPRLREGPRTVALARAATTGTPAAPGAAVPVAIAPAAAPNAFAPAPAGKTEPESAESARLAWRGPVSVKAGEVFAVPLHMLTPTALRGALVELGFAADQLEVLEITEGTFFKQAGGQTSFTQSLDAREGKISLGVLRSDLSGATGDAPMAELRLRAKAAGSIELKVTSLRPVGLGGAAPSARLSAFRFTAQ